MSYAELESFKQQQQGYSPKPENQDQKFNQNQSFNQNETNQSAVKIPTNIEVSFGE